MKQTFSIPKLHCSSCAILLEQLEEEYSSVSEVVVNIPKRQATIEFNETQLTTQELIQAIKNISGYEAIIHAN